MGKLIAEANLNWENLAGNLAGKSLRENSCGKFLQENLMGLKMRENVDIGNSCGKILRKIRLAGKSCRKLLWEIVARKSCGKWRRGKSQFKKDSENLAFN